MHSIRLRGPWDFLVLAHTVLMADGSTRTEAGQLPAGGRIRMPADWGQTLGTEFRGRVLLSRSFHRPTGLTADSRVWLAIDEVDCYGDVTLNDSRIGRMRGDDGGQRFEITRLLDRKNQVSVLVECPRVTPDSPALPRPPGRDGQPGGLIGEVRLEIEESSGRNLGLF